MTHLQLLFSNNASKHFVTVSVLHERAGFSRNPRTTYLNFVDLNLSQSLTCSLHFNFLRYLHSLNVCFIKFSFSEPPSKFNTIEYNKFSFIRICVKRLEAFIHGRANQKSQVKSNWVVMALSESIVILKCPNFDIRVLFVISTSFNRIRERSVSLLLIITSTSFSLSFSLRVMGV